MKKLKTELLPKLKSIREKSNPMVASTVTVLMAILQQPDGRKPSEGYDKVLHKLEAVHEDIASGVIPTLCDKSQSLDHYFLMKVFLGATNRCIVAGKALHQKYPMMQLCKSYRREPCNADMVRDLVWYAFVQLQEEIQYSHLVIGKNQFAEASS